MSRNYYLQAVLDEADRLRLAVSVLNSFIDRYMIQTVSLHPPQCLFAHPKTFRYPRTYRVSMEARFDIDSLSTDGLETGPIQSKSNGDTQVAISHAQMATYLKGWTDRFSIEFAIQDEDDCSYICNIAISFNGKYEIKDEIQDFSSANIIITSPSVRNNFILEYIENISNIFEMKNFRYGMIAFEFVPIVGSALAIISKREFDEQLKYLTHDMKNIEGIIAVGEGISIHVDKNYLRSW